MRINNPGDAQKIQYNGLFYVIEPGISDYEDGLGQHIVRKLGQFGLTDAPTPEEAQAAQAQMQAKIAAKGATAVSRPRPGMQIPVPVKEPVNVLEEKQSAAPVVPVEVKATPKRASRGTPRTPKPKRKPA